MRDERIALAGFELVLARPDDPESLIDEGRFEEDEFLPYWAELWPSARALASHLVSLDLEGTRVLELGCGLALPSFAAAIAGAESVLATDWAPEAVQLVQQNAIANGLDLTAAVVDWRSDASPPGAPFDLVLAADVLYEERNAAPLLRLFDLSLTPRGEVHMADPGRRHAAGFGELARGAGWTTEHISVDGLPAGGISVFRRSAGGRRPPREDRV